MSETLESRRVGILRGIEETFPEALIEYINRHHYPSVHATFVSIDAVRMNNEPNYDVILDRISHEVPFYRSYLKWAALHGTYIVNNPFWWSADDKFIDNIIAEAAGVAVPRSLILPHKEHPPNTQDTSFRNLVFPLDWQAVFDYIGFPAFIKPHDGGGWRGVTRVTNPDELYSAYDASGTDCMMLQEAIEFESYFRCYCIGQQRAHIMRYNPLAPHHRRYHDVPTDPIDPTLFAQLERDVLAICRALGYDMNTVELAVRDGIPYAIDFMNPAPDANYHSVGQDNFSWVVQETGDFLVKKALETDRPLQFSANGVLEPARATRP